MLESDYGKAGSSAESAFFGASKGKKSGSKDGKFKPKCFNCGVRGHISKDCKSKKKSDDKDKDESKSKPKTNAFYAFHANSANNASSKSNEWYIDSGASRHMTANRNWLSNVKNSPIAEITAANNSKMAVSACGSVALRVDSGNIEIKNVLCVPELTNNLLSVAQIVENGNTVVFDRNGCSVYNEEDDLIVQAKVSNGVYKLENQNVSCMQATATDELMTWHRRLGHINYADLRKMKNGIVDGISFAESSSGIADCEVCMEGKQTRASFNHTGSRAKNLLDLVHSDVCGPMENSSIDGARYFLTFIDDHSRKVFVYFLKAKSDVFETFKNFKQMAENQTERKIKVIRSDGGKEYCNHEFENFCKRSGIVHQKTNAYTPEQNGVSERMNRTLVERAKCMIFDAKLDVSFWGEAVNTAAYIINRSVASSLVDNTPEGIWTGSKVDLRGMRIFGSPVMVHVPKQRRRKWDTKSTKMLFIGYGENTKGYRCIDPLTKKIEHSRDVVFMETQAKVIESDSIEIDEIVVSVGDANDKNESSEEDESSEEESTRKPDSSNASNEPKPSDVVQSQVRRSSRIPKPIDYGRFGYVTYAAMIDESGTDPITIDEALSRDDKSNWEAAMDSELLSLEENNTWTLVDLPPGRKAIRNKWVFKTKRDGQGNVVRHKARLVAKGCSQQYGIDYTETYCPVVRYTSIRYLIALAVKLKLHIDQMDAVTAFLQGDLSEEIYMLQPDGCSDGSKRVCKLNKSMYGLKQSGRQWNKKLEQMLKSFGLRKSKVDPCVYFAEDKQLIVAIYVDDILIFWRDAAIRDKLKAALCDAFHMKDMGMAKQCIGLNITYDESGGIWLDQSKYIHDILARFGMSDCKPVKTPSDPNQKLSIEMCDSEDENSEAYPYQEAVGSLLYLVQGTRPDIAFAVNDVSRFNNNHGKAHWAAVKRIFRYIKGTADLKIKYSGDSALSGFVDADWASDVDKRRSCTAYVFTMGGGAISWNSKRQATVALSSTEAEYMALSTAAQEAAWLRQFGDELDSSLKEKPIVIACDNQSAINLAETDGFRVRSKHIDIRHHHIRDKIEDETIEIRYLPTEEMVADSLTKAVASSKHQYCRNLMGLQSIKN